MRKGAKSLRHNTALGVFEQSPLLILGTGEYLACFRYVENKIKSTNAGLSMAVSLLLGNFPKKWGHCHRLGIFEQPGHIMVKVIYSQVTAIEYTWCVRNVRLMHKMHTPEVGF